MTDHAPPANHPDTDEDPLLDVLDDFMHALHRGDRTKCRELLEQHPAVRELAACLEDLDSLAVGPSGAARDDRASTVVLGAADREGNLGLSEHLDPAGGSGTRDFGKYELLEEIGRGGMAVVYKARQKDLDRIVALKMILSSRLASSDDVRRFYVEARAAGQLRHANIVGIHEVGQVHGQHYIAMDYVDGATLDLVLHKEPYAALLAAGHDALRSAGVVPARGKDTQAARLGLLAGVRCLLAVARAVEYLHSQNLVHRDLKPSNILIDGAGQPYVSDFGLAKVFAGDSQHTQSGAIVGTPSYMSPEQAAGRTHDVSPRSDVYSLGAILYEILTGRPPFREQNPLDTLIQVLEDEPAAPRQLNPLVPRELQAICLRCLEKDPHKRFGSAAEFADELERFLQGEPIVSRATGVWQRTRRWIRREPALVGRLLAFAVAVLIVQARYVLGDPDWDYHVKIMSVFGVWAVASFVFQKLMNVERLADVVRFAWAAGDAVLLTTLLSIAKGPLGPLLIGYPALVAASGLFFRVRLVWFTTLASLIGYAALLRFQPAEAGPPHYPVIFAALLTVVGFIVGYQVYRLRILSRYFERRG